eukprot:Opistho-2@19595
MADSDGPPARPKAKAGAARLPVPRSLPVPVESVGTWWQCVGVLRGSAVVITDAASAAKLYAQGCFGKGTLSRSKPIHATREEERHKSVRLDRLARRKDKVRNRADTPSRARGQHSQPNAGVNYSLQALDNPTCATASLSADRDAWRCDDDSGKSHLGESGVGQIAAGHPGTLFAAPGESLLPVPVHGRLPVRQPHEMLQLFPEEAFFLAHSLNCLRVHLPTDGPERVFLTSDELWGAFLATRASFPHSYAAYHHYRTKGWVPRSGLKFGLDYVLYDKGPEYCHSSYGVIVRPAVAGTLDNAATGDPSLVHLTWQSLGNANRVGEQISKDVLVTYVVAPPNTAVSTPECLSHMTVCEVVFRRWMPQRTR